MLKKLACLLALIASPLFAQQTPQAQPLTSAACKLDGTVGCGAGGGGGSGTVTSVAMSGGTTGFSFSGGPITTSGTFTLSGTLAVANGGTGATSASAARTALGAAAATDATITNTSGNTPLILHAGPSPDEMFRTEDASGTPEFVIHPGGDVNAFRLTLRPTSDARALEAHRSSSAQTAPIISVSTGASGEGTPNSQLASWNADGTITAPGFIGNVTGTATPLAHASSHQNGGSDEVATATAAANAIPKAGAGGKLAVGWVPVATGDAGSGGTAGLVPAPATGDATKFLRGDMTYVAISGGGDALTANPLSQFASTTSAQLAGVLSDEIGSSGGFVRGTGSTLTNTTMAGTLNLPGGTLASIPATCAIRDVYVATDQTGGRVWYICTATNTWSLVSPAGNPFTDNEDLGFNAADPSKLFRLDLSGFTTGTRRTQAPPNANGTWLLRDDVATVTNKRITPRVGTTTSTATPSIDSDLYDVYRITALAVDITGVTVTGTPTDSQMLRLVVTTTGGVQNITLGSQFEASTIPLPSDTGANPRVDFGFTYNSDTSKWRLLARS